MPSRRPSPSSRRACASSARSSARTQSAPPVLPAPAPCALTRLPPRRSAFRVAEDARLARLSNKLSESLARPKALTDAEEYRRKKDGYEEIEGETPVAGSSKGPSVCVCSARGPDADPLACVDMDVDGSAPAAEEAVDPDAKVSTSGPRMSRRESYRAHKGFQIRLKPNTLFRGAFGLPVAPRR